MTPSLLLAKVYGEKIQIKRNPISIAEAIKAHQNGDTILVNAVVDKVCKKKGCWMTFKDIQSDHRVTFKDYSFFVPVSIVGKRVKVLGVLEKKAMTLEETKHMAEDEGKDPAKVTKPGVEYRIVASGVETL